MKEGRPKLKTAQGQPIGEGDREGVQGTGAGAAGILLTGWLPLWVPIIPRANSLALCRLKWAICWVDRECGAEANRRLIQAAAEEDLEPSATAANSKSNAALALFSCRSGGRHHPRVTARHLPAALSPPISTAHVHRPVDEHTPVSQLPPARHCLLRAVGSRVCSVVAARKEGGRWAPPGGKLASRSNSTVQSSRSTSTARTTIAVNTDLQLRRRRTS
mmetsp:Transcript_3075/g.5595  ORF Transcript_3075/g.5595 Transcript_3075/m.5595 type:complete len:218 (-) Transcript_3075:217-870(-)